MYTNTAAFIYNYISYSDDPVELSPFSLLLKDVENKERFDYKIILLHCLINYTYIVLNASYYNVIYSYVYSIHTCICCCV